MYITIGKKQIPEKDAKATYLNGIKYVVTYSAVYSLDDYPTIDGDGWSVGAREIHYKKGIAKRGTYKFCTASEVNSLLGYDLLRTN